MKSIKKLLNEAPSKIIESVRDEVEAAIDDLYPRRSMAQREYDKNPSKFAKQMEYETGEDLSEIEDVLFDLFG